MKRCPECRRDYYDETLSFCLEDGTPLVYGVSGAEVTIPISSGFRSVPAGFPAGEAPTKQQIETSEQTAVLQLPSPSSRASSAEYLVNQFKNNKSVATFGFAGFVLVSAVIGFWFFRGRTQNETASPSVSLPLQNIRLSLVPDWNNGRQSALSPDSKYIAFSEDEGGGNYSLSLRQLATGTTSKLLPPQLGTMHFLEFSPDGNYIYYLFSSKSDTHSRLFRLPALGGGSAPHEIISDVNSKISFAPDGKRFAFTRHSAKDGNDSIMIADIDGVELQKLATADDIGFKLFGNLSWSPDGTKIMTLTSQQTDEGLDELLGISVLDGSHKLLQTKKFAGMGMVSWLKGGSGLIFTGWDAPSAPTQIWYVAYPSGETRQITNDANDYESFSLAQNNASLIATKGDFRASVSIVDPRTKAPVQISSEYRLLNPGYSSLTISRSGKIVFAKPREGDLSNLWTMDATGKNAQAISPDLIVISHPVVTPDENYIVFTSLQSGTSQIWRTDINGNNPIQLTNGGNQANSCPQITHDGRSILFLRQSQGSNEISLMLMSLDGKEMATIDGTEPVLHGFELQISPDGTHIGMGVFDPDTRRRYLVVMPFDGTRVGPAERRIEFEPGSGWFHWSPDGRSITYIEQKGANNLWQMPLDPNGKRKQLTDFTSGVISDFVWSDDGKQLFVVRSIANSELILIKDAQVS